MSNSLRDLFFPTPEQEIERLEKLLFLIKDQSSKQHCFTCKHYIPADPSLSGFVTDYGVCNLNLFMFSEKVCGLNDISCLFYEYDIEQELEIRNKIEKLKKAGDK